MYVSRNQNNLSLMGELLVCIACITGFSWFALNNFKVKKNQSKIDTDFKLQLCTRLKSSIIPFHWGNLQKKYFSKIIFNVDNALKIKTIVDKNG